ncbi:hypothetical protein D3C85_1095990 [compost metagenome]
MVEAANLAFHALPPDVGGAAAVVVQPHLGGAAAGLAQPLLVRLAQLDPLFDLVAEILVPQVRLVVVADAAGEGHVFAGVQREHRDAQHHAFDGFRRVLRDGQAMAVVIAAIHVGNGEIGFVDGGFQCHGGLSLGKVSVKAGSVPLLPRQRPWRRVLLPLGDSICLR